MESVHRYTMDCLSCRFKKYKMAEYFVRTTLFLVLSDKDKKIVMRNVSMPFFQYVTNNNKKIKTEFL